jgi:hypothetical protein
MLLTQKAADAILPKPGTGKERQLNFSMSPGDSYKLFG